MTLSLSEHREDEVCYYVHQASPLLVRWPPESRVQQTRESGHPQQLFSVRGWYFGWPLSHWGSTVWAEMIGVPGKHWQQRGGRVTEHQETVERTCEPCEPSSSKSCWPYSPVPFPAHVPHRPGLFSFWFWYLLVLIVWTALLVEGRGPSKSDLL